MIVNLDNEFIRPPNREYVARRSREKIFVPPVEISVSSTRAPRIICITDFQDFHHKRVSTAVTNQYLIRGTPLPEIINQADIHEFDIREGSHALATLLDNAPKGTVALAVVDPTVNVLPNNLGWRDEIVIKTLAEHYIVIPNNGLATFPILAHGIEAAWHIDHAFFLDHHVNGSACQGEDLFAPAAAFVALGSENISKFAKPIEIEAVKTFNVEVGEAIGSDAFGQVRYALYLPPNSSTVDILRKDGTVLKNIPVQQEGGFGDLPPNQLSVYASSGFKRNGVGVAEATINQGRAADIIGKNSKIVRIQVFSGNL